MSLVQQGVLPVGSVKKDNLANVPTKTVDELTGNANLKYFLIQIKNARLRLTHKIILSCFFYKYNNLFSFIHKCLIRTKNYYKY